MKSLFRSLVFVSLLLFIPGDARVAEDSQAARWSAQRELSEVSDVSVPPNHLEQADKETHVSMGRMSRLA
eukprot:746632-Hanusia_phi.AAC.1